MHFIRGLGGWAARQAYLWAALGILGVAFAAAGLILLTGDDGDGSSSPSGADGREASSTATASAPAVRTSTTSVTPTASTSPASLSPVASETPSATASPIPTQAAQGQQNPSTGGSQATPVPPPPTTVPPTPEPTSEPTTTRSFCNTTSSSSPPNSIFGLLTIGGQPGPAGTMVTITFDGAPGPSVTTIAAGGYRVDFPSGGEDCANRAGSGLAIVVNGQSFAAGTLGGSPANRFDITVP